MKGFFGDLFNFNHDGQLDGIEQAADFAAFANMMDNVEDEERITALELSGLDPEELEFMDPEEGRDALEDAGLDPSEYDF